MGSDRVSKSFRTIIICVISRVLSRVESTRLAHRVPARCCSCLCRAGGGAARRRCRKARPAFDGKVAVSGEVIATGGNADDIAFFNYTDYEHNALRMIRFGVSGVYRPATWLALVGEAAIGGPGTADAVRRLRATCSPWRNHAFDIQAGRIPPAFGRFGRRLYETGNPVIGYPLAYQYLTSLRTDAIPATADDVLRMRARGWRSSFPVGSQEPGPGVPLISGFQWDTGVEASWQDRASSSWPARSPTARCRIRASRTTTAGNSSPAASRVTPAVGLDSRRSAARGAWLSRTVAPDSEPGAANRSAPTPSTRAITGSSAASWSGAAGAFRTRCGPPTPTRSTRWAPGSRAAIASRRGIFFARRVDRLGFSTLHGARSGQRSAVGRARQARRRRDRLLPAAQSSCVRTSVQGNWRDGGRDRNRDVSLRPAGVLVLMCQACFVVRRRRSDGGGDRPHRRRRAAGRRGACQRDHPRPRRAAAVAVGRAAPRVSVADLGMGATHEPPDRRERRLSRSGAARRVRHARRAARRAWTSATRRSCRTCSRSSPARRSISRTTISIYHNVFSLSKTKTLRSRPLCRRAARSRCGSIGRASCACSATSTRT